MALYWGAIRWGPIPRASPMTAPICGWPTPWTARLPGCRPWTARSGGLPGGEQPHAVLFDGQHIWVSNHLGDSVTQFRVRDGELLGTFPVGRRPLGLAFDGVHLWVANEADGTLTKLRAADGFEQPEAVASSCPWGVAVAREYLWVTNHGDNRVTKIRRRDGRVMGSLPRGGPPWPWPLMESICGSPTGTAGMSPSSGRRTVTNS